MLSWPSKRSLLEDYLDRLNRDYGITFTEDLPQFTLVLTTDQPLSQRTRGELTPILRQLTDYRIEFRAP